MNIQNHTIRAHEDAQRRAILRWAEVAAAEHHDLEIIVPPEFNREDALHALEMAVVRKYRFIGAGVQIGQGRTSADIRWSGASLALTLVLGVAIGLAALAAIVWWAI